MLVDSTTTPTIHHYLLIFVDSITTFPTWQIILPWNRIEIYSRYLHEHIVACDVEFQILQIVVYVIN